MEPSKRLPDMFSASTTGLTLLGSSGLRLTAVAMQTCRSGSQDCTVALCMGRMLSGRAFVSMNRNIPSTPAFVALKGHVTAYHAWWIGQATIDIRVLCNTPPY